MIKHRLHGLQKQITQIIVLSTIYYLLSTNSYAQSFSSSELINDAKQYDGKTVIYEGEVIGDIMLRQDYAWLNVNDSGNAIGVWIKASLAKDILNTGSYKAKGDVLEVTGIFHRACPQHGGDLDIHALSVKKTALGRNVPERLDPGKKNFALILVAVLCAIWILRLLKIR